jgi:ribonuclease HI
MKYIDESLIYCDGGCKPNPGIMVGAFLITDGENILKGPVGNNFGEGTNIVAELKAIEYALDEAVSCTRKKVIVHCDNEFVIKALNKERRITKGKHLKPIITEIYKKASMFEEVVYTHVSENNRYIKKCNAKCNELFNKLGFD